MGADRGAPATREATEKENTAAAKLREEVCREKSRILPQHPQHRAFLSGKMPVAARTLLGLAGLHFFQAEDPLKEKHRSGGVGRTKFSEVDRGASRNIIVLAGSVRCCFALRVIRTRYLASPGCMPHRAAYRSSRLQNTLQAPFKLPSSTGQIAEPASCRVA